MHFHADHALFFEQRPSIRRAGAAVALTVAVLVVNAGADSMVGSLIGAGFGALLLVLARVRGAGRIEPAIAWVLALVGIGLVAGLGLRADADALFRTGARIFCGVVWVLWLGTEVDWASLRQLLLKLRVPESIVSSLDHALMHGVLTKREWIQRRDAARSRLGTRRLSLGVWAPLLSEGAFHAFTRLEQVEETATIRAAACSAVATNRAIEFDGVNVDRDGTRVLSDVSLGIDRGEWVVLCGPSGAGKSSLLRLLAGLDKPTQGTMNRLGVAVSHDTSLTDRLDGQVALLAQNPEHHFVASTVAEDIAWGLLRRGVGSEEAHRRSVEVANDLGIGHLLARPCHQLSFGEQRRVALAGLLVVEPALLLLDEPTSGLDPVAAHELSALVERMVEQSGATCVWATHDLHSIPPRTERVVLLRGGRVIFAGEPSIGLSDEWLVKAGLSIP
ncbi:MAG: ABC transporter ATP-binding protein [Myxococcota bacterium]|nr:ABC transporter ATP-binding protein [Myxococcota bacterium]MEC9388962.1 ABC transporter ATP-binding protein [Myxococcota bacterium]